MSLQNEIAKLSEALSLNVISTENEIMKKLRKDIRVGVSSIKDNFAKLNEELIDNDDRQKKKKNRTVSPINFILSMMISKRKKCNKACDGRRNYKPAD